MDLATFKQSQRAAWAAGDYPSIGRLLEPAARILVDRVGITPGQRVLDVATGSGSVAIAAAFDVVLSSFGAIFAPRHEIVAGELARVCRPGGTIAFTAWTAGGPNDDVFSAIVDHLPEPPGFVEASIGWGDPDHVRSNEADDGTYRATWDFLVAIGSAGAP